MCWGNLEMTLSYGRGRIIYEGLPICAPIFEKCGVQSVDTFRAMGVESYVVGVGLARVVTEMSRDCVFREVTIRDSDLSLFSL